jgi:SAM-dependent methyltransferase
MDNIEWKIQNYWDRQPCNINHSQQPVGSAEYFAEVTAKRYRAEPHILDFAEFHRWRGLRVLEIGCGIGTDAEQFARHGADYVGIDISETSLDICRQRFEVLELPGQFIKANLLDDDFSFRDELGQFDLVYSYGVIHHFPRIYDHIRVISELVRSHGEFRFMVYAKNSWKYAMIQKGLDQFEAQAECPYAQAFDYEEIKNLLYGHFDVQNITQDHCFMYNVPEYKQGNFELEPWFAAMPERMREAIKEYMGWHLLVKARKHETFIPDLA